MKKGFTLVELSIVLVIIGLLIGGILVGQSLIDSSKLQALIKKLQQYDIAGQSFETKYKGQVPGDTPALGCVVPPAIVCGDKQIYSDTFLYASGNGRSNTEAFNFWLNLNQSGMTGKVYSGYPTGGFSPNTFPGDFTGYVPSVDYGKKSFINAITITKDFLNRNSDFGSAWIITTNPVATAVMPSMTTVEALAIDSKLDDNVANTGNVQGLYNGYSGPWIVSTTGGGTCTNYNNLTSATPVCALAIKANW